MQRGKKVVGATREGMHALILRVSTPGESLSEASERFGRILLTVVRHYVAKGMRGAQTADVDDAVSDVVLMLIPFLISKYDPTRSQLVTLLRLPCRWRLSRALERSSRQKGSALGNDRAAALASRELPVGAELETDEGVAMMWRLLLDESPLTSLSPAAQAAVATARDGRVLNRSDARRLNSAVGRLRQWAERTGRAGYRS